MIIKGKEINADTVTMWLNVLSVFVGIIFYIRLENKYMSSVTPYPIINHTEDSIFYINTQLKFKLDALKLTQDSLLKEIRHSNDLTTIQKKKVAVIRHQLHTTINSDWDSLNAEQQNAYIQQFITNLKNKHK